MTEEFENNINNEENQELSKELNADNSVGQSDALNQEILDNSPVENSFNDVAEQGDVVTDEVSGQEGKMISVRPVKFQEFQNDDLVLSPKRNLDILQDIPMHVSVELGKTKSSIREVMEFQHGSVLELDKIAGEQVEIYVNKKLVAKGEVIVIEDKFGVRIVSTNLPKANV